MPPNYSLNEADHYSRLRDIDGVGEIEGPSVEYHLFRAGTGVDWPEEEFQRAAERICTLERALHVRHWARDRQTDEMVLPYFEEPELYPNPLIGKHQGLDREQFKPVMDRFYQLHGWDVKRAWPTPERLCGLDLEGVYQPMIEGATRARDEAVAQLQSARP
jgi:aldehyde:ferredoxin oxidoreductase